MVLLDQRLIYFKKMLQMFILLFLCFKTGAFGSSRTEMQSFSVTEGDSVTLHSGVTELHTGELTWHFVADKSLIALINRAYQAFSTMNGTDGRFRDRLKLDNNTGSLTIINIRSEHAGDYEVQIFSDNTSSKRFRVTVYARLPVPVITRNFSHCSSSSSSSSQYNCSVLCSVENVSSVSLSWYKGNSLLSSISVSDLSISLSLPLEVEYQDKNTYNCVINNTISRQTTHLDINTHCQACPDDLPVFNIAFLCAALSLLIVVIIVMCCKKWRKTGQESKRSAKCEPKTRKVKSENTDAVYENVPKNKSR
ncbi:CD48 antigen-like isoform X2 [Danio aesculapii]|uniref:CD48 antigen-like isoform X2 n=1 Tax=Danio aesculapii TaxID=1142201 RepID=UPI0024C098AD|nr:CD48 antigen-like isoform X2 [Danio aesculapii]